MCKCRGAWRSWEEEREEEKKEKAKRMYERLREVSRISSGSKLGLLLRPHLY